MCADIQQLVKEEPEAFGVTEALLTKRPEIHCVYRKKHCPTQKPKIGGYLSMLSKILSAILAVKAALC